jgi:hypothetical protein
MSGELRLNSISSEPASGQLNYEHSPGQSRRQVSPRHQPFHVDLREQRMDGPRVTRFVRNLAIWENISTSYFE